MAPLKNFVAGLRALFGGKQSDRELDQELRDYLDFAVAAKIKSGMDRAQALREARMEMGSLDSVKEEVRSTGWESIFASMWQDVRYAVRMLRRSPGFTAVAVLTLALGIGANTAIFSVLDAVVLRPLPFASPSRLVHLTGKFALGDTAGISPPDYSDYRAANRTFEQLAVLSYEDSISNLSGHEKPEQVTSSITSWNLFDALGIKPLLGRTLVPADEQAEQPQVVILGNGIWRTHFGADPKIIGKQIVLDDRTLTVVGVLSSDPSILSKAQVWLPLPLLGKGMKVRLAHFLVGIGKLKPGVTLDQAQADLDDGHSGRCVTDEGAATSKPASRRDLLLDLMFESGLQRKGPGDAKEEFLLQEAGICWLHLQ